MSEKSNQKPLSFASRVFVGYLIVVATTALLYFTYLIRPVILQVILALIVALALAPAVKALVRRGMGRIAATTVALLSTLALFMAVAAAIATPLIAEASNLAKNAPTIIDDLTNNSQLQRLNQDYQIIDKAKELAKEAPAKLVGASSPILGALSGVVGAVSTTLVVLVLAFFLLIEGPRSWQRFLMLLIPEQARRVERTGQKVAAAISGFVSGSLFIGLIAGLITLVTLLILGVPYAFALAALVALFSLIPMVGATIASIVVGLVALTQGWVVALTAVAVLLVYQFIEGQVIQPLVHSRTVALSPLLIILASIIGATIGGILGILLAIPAAAVTQIVIVEILSGTASGRRAHLKEA